jgi:hypothetical protein
VPAVALAEIAWRNLQMNDAMRRLDALVGEWDVAMTNARFLGSPDAPRAC